MVEFGEHSIIIINCLNNTDVEVMSEFLKTAMGYFNTNGVSQTSHYPPSNTSSNGVLGGVHEVPGDNVQHSHKSNTSWLSNEELCGHLVHLPGIKLRVKETLAIGNNYYYMLCLSCNKLTYAPFILLI